MSKRAEHAAFLEVKTSTIPDAGLGVFALRDIKKGERLGEYTGRRIDEKTFQRMQNTQYVFEVSLAGGKSEYIDAESSPCIMARINGAKTDAQKKKVNVRSYQYAKRIFYQAKQDIGKGEELLIYYGPDYEFEE